MSDKASAQQQSEEVRNPVREAVDRLVGTPLSEDDRALLTGRNFGHLATLYPDGSPHSTVVWVDADQNHVVFNTAEGRLKARHVRENPRVAISVADSQNPYHAVAIHGRVVEVTGDGADAHIDSLAQRYLGRDRYPFRRPGERRLLVRILPTRIHRSG